MSFDGKGLYLEIMPTGSKFWRVRRRSGKSVKITTFGRWPTISLKRARELNDRLLMGEPAEPAEPETPASPPTVADLCGEWRLQFLSGKTPVGIDKLAILFDKHICPAIGMVPAADLTPQMVLNDLLKPILATGHVETAHRVRSTLGRVLRFGMASCVLDRDVTVPLAGALPPAQVRHRPAIKEEARIGRLIIDIRNYDGSFVVGRAMLMLAYVFTRPGELRGAVWEEFDLREGLWRIPAERMKMRTPHVVPLARQVIGILDELRPITGAGRYLFPGRNIKTKPISDMAINAALRYLGYGRDEICGHGFRSMASTLLNERGYNSDWIERQLAHVERNGVRAAYNHADWLPERRKMMQDWADLLDSLAAEAAARVR
jgi:integrase